MARTPNIEPEAEKITAALADLNSREDNTDTEHWEHFALGYCISSIGRVWNICNNAFITCYANCKSQKHKCFEMSHKGKDEKIYIHKAVYCLFGKFGKGVVYPFDLMVKRSKYVVHHIDENPENNDISNLYLMTRKLHTKLTMQLYHGKIQQSEVNTPEKLDQWVMLNTDALQWFTNDKKK